MAEEPIVIAVLATVKAERERCAKIAEELGAKYGEHAIGAAIADEIRKMEGADGR